jgi:arginase
MTAPSSCDITYVPADCGSTIFGKSKAPDAFKSIDIVSRLRNAGVSAIREINALTEPANWSITTFEPGKVRNEELNVEVNHKVFNALQQHLSTAKSNEELPFQLVLGGECCMLPGIVSQLTVQSKGIGQQLGLIYIDADTDLNSPSDPGSTGNMAAQTMSLLVGAPGGLPSMDFFHESAERTLCDASNTVLFGTNMSCATNKTEHYAYLFENQYRVIPSTSVAKDPELQAHAALKYLDQQSIDSILVHLDVDAIDPGEFPLANLPNHTGVRFDVMMRALGVFMASNKTVALCVAEVNPDHDPGLKMTTMLADAIAEMLGKRNQ